MARISPDPSRTAMDFQLVNFDNPTEVRTFEKGRFELYNVGKAPAKSRFVPIVQRPHVVAGSQIPATGIFGHLMQTATLPGPRLKGAPDR